MRHCTLTITLIAGAFLLAQDGAAQVPQFTFIVPVQLSNLQEDVKNASISCALFRQTDWLTANTNTVMIDISPKCAGCPPSDFTGNVTVRVSLPPESIVKPEDVTNYKCTLILNATSLQPTGLQKTGTVFQPEVSGTIP